MLPKLLHTTLLCSVLASTSVGAEDAGPIAIRCQGTAELKYKGKISRSWPTRIYVIDSSKKWIAYWNPDKEEQIPVCQSNWQKCIIEFGPRIIEASGNLNQFYGFYMTIDRRDGFLDYRSLSNESKWDFVGHCVKIDMPTPSATENKF